MSGSNGLVVYDCGHVSKLPVGPMIILTGSMAAVREGARLIYREVRLVPVSTADDPKGVALHGLDDVPGHYDALLAQVKGHLQDCPRGMGRADLVATFGLTATRWQIVRGMLAEDPQVVTEGRGPGLRYVIAKAEAAP